jgi:hypothetical protein
MESVEKRIAAPPYVAYKTLSNFLDRFKQGVPGRIDRGLMASMSGAAQSQVTTALRFLGMISENGIPTKTMREYLAREDEERKKYLADILAFAYPFIFVSDSFDLATATASQLRDAFEANTSASGETVGRCMSFFKDAAADAGLKVSPYITQKKARTPGVRRRPQPRREEKHAAEKHTPAAVHTPPPASIPAQASLLLSGLFQRLPKPGTVWPKEDRERWVQTLQNVLLLEYPESSG